MNVSARLWAAAALASLLSILTAGALRLDKTPVGLTGSYESLGGSTRTTTAVDRAPSTAAAINAWSGAPPGAFSVSWRGVIYIPHDGAYSFATRTDGEATVYLDGRQILENGWGQPTLIVRETVRPDSGEHAITINYRHNAGPIHIELLWAHGDEPLVPVPSWVLRTQRTGWLRILLKRWETAALPAAEWSAVLLALAALAAGLWLAGTRLVVHLRRLGTPAALAWIVIVSVILNVTGLWWGLPGGSWAPIELVPISVIGGLAEHFSHGWSDAYPPVHFYVLSIAISPVLILDWLGRIDLHDIFWVTTMIVITRLVSVAMATGTIVSVFLCGRLAFSRRAGVFAAAVFALCAPFLYFSKTANVDVPYTFWFSLSLMFYLLVLRDGRLRDYVGLAAAATLSICTKDQAYGLFLLPPLVIVWERGMNRRVGVAALVSVAGFVLSHNLLFNFSGFLSHVQFITGTGSTYYRLFEPTLAGRMGLLRLTTRLTELSWGWPLFLVCVTGVVLGLAAASSRRAAIWLLAPIVGYYVGFLNVILYAYDRFTLPICLVLALFGGFILDRFTVSATGRAWRAAAVSLAFAYTLLYSGTVDVLMLRDSRYAAERWLAAQPHVGDDLIGINELQTYLPRLSAYHLGAVISMDDLRAAQPRFFVLNADYTRGDGQDTADGPVIAGLERDELGYTRVYDGRTPPPWPWLPGADPDLTGPRLEPTVVSTLRNINPEIEIFQRDQTIGR